MKHNFPPLASQHELDAEIRRARLIERAARVAEFFALAVLIVALAVFGPAAVQMIGG